MKDKLGRDIVVGDTLAAIDFDYSYASGGSGGRAVLTTAKVVGVAPFAVQIEFPAKPKEEPRKRVFDDTQGFIIVELSTR